MLGTCPTLQGVASFMPRVRNDTMGFNSAGIFEEGLVDRAQGAKVRVQRAGGAMAGSAIEQLLEQLAAGRLTPSDLSAVLARTASGNLGDAVVDLDRARRCGYPEVVFGEGKPLPVLERIVERLAAGGQHVLVTRIDAEKGAGLFERFPQGRYNDLARTFRLDWADALQRVDVTGATEHDTADSRRRRGRVTVVTAGTSDLPIAEEARETLDWMGVEVTVVQDVGVAGPHRLIERLDSLRGADAIVVVAGMEGALPSVVGGHVDCPVIAVPTSVGYGASFGGLAALLGMLNSCAANVVVVNIDAGFKGGYVAGTIARRCHGILP